MVDLLIIVLVVALALLVIWLSLKIFFILLPYLIIGVIVWLIWRNRARIAKLFKTRDP